MLQLQRIKGYYTYYKKDMKICEKLAELRGFGPNYCTVPIGVYTDIFASEFFKMPGSEQTTPNPAPKRY